MYVRLRDKAIMFLANLLTLSYVRNYKREDD
jgi:hypothetical protein